jgi:hypothetical protein
MPSEKHLWHKDLQRTVVPLYIPPLVPVRRLYHSLLTHLIPQDKEKDPAPFSPQPCATVASSQNQRLGDDCCSVHKAPLFSTDFPLFGAWRRMRGYKDCGAARCVHECVKAGHSCKAPISGKFGKRRERWFRPKKRAFLQPSRATLSLPSPPRRGRLLHAAVDNAVRHNSHVPRGPSIHDNRMNRATILHASSRGSLTCRYGRPP